jgi:hypothetical protein
MMVAFLSRGRAQLDVLNQSGAWDISPWVRWINLL